MRKKILVILLVFVLCFLQARKAVKASLWDGSSRISWVIQAESIVVASLEPKGFFSILSLPDNLYLDLPHGLGKYQLGSVYELGELEKRGGELLREAIQNYLGIPVDGYIKMSNVKCQMSNCLVPLLRGRGETNFSKLDLLRLWWKIRGLRSDKIKSVNLSETNVLKKGSLADGSEILETEFFRLDEVVKKYFSDSQIEKERIKIEILNATEQPGLANKAARLITNIGGEVVAIGNSELEARSSKLEARNESIKKSYTVRKLEKTLGVKGEVGEMGESRADLLILVGEDYWEKLTNF